MEAKLCKRDHHRQRPVLAKHTRNQSSQRLPHLRSPLQHDNRHSRLLQRSKDQTPTNAHNSDALGRIRRHDCPSRAQNLPKLNRQQQQQ